MKRNLQRISTALFRLLTLKHYPYEGVFGREVAFFATKDRTIIVAIKLDYTDHNYNAIIFGRDDAMRYRSFGVEVSLTTINEAVDAAQKFIDKISINPDHFEGIAHCFFTSDKRICHVVPPFFPLNSFTFSVCVK